MTLAFGEAAQAYEEMVAAVRADPDQSWRDRVHLHYVEVMLVRAGRESMRLARRLEIPEAAPNTNEVKGLVDLLWDAALVLTAGKIHPKSAEHVEAMWRMMKQAEKDGEVTRTASDAELSDKLTHQGTEK